MKRCLILLLGLAWLGVATTAAAQYAPLPADKLYRTDEQRYGHLQYFGFYASAMGGWNYTEELAPFTNLTWIHVGGAEDSAGAIDEMMFRLAQARDSGVQAVLSIEPFLFANERGDLLPDSTIEDFLVDLRAHLEEQQLFDTLVMIYPKDEPFREFVNARDPSVVDKYVTGDVYEDVHEVLMQANSLIKLVFPEVPIGVILSGYEISHDFFSIPENYDWVGFDCYDNLFKGCDDRSFVRHYSQLLEHMQPHQQLMAVPETWVQNDDMGRASWPDVLMQRLRHHYEMALNEPRFIAFIPFLWSFDANAPVPGLGLNRVSELFDDGVENRGTALVNAVQDIGLQIKTGQHRFPNLAWHETEDSRHRPNSQIRGEIMSVTPQGLVSAWAFDNALPHKNLRVQVRVRDGRDRIVYKSAVERTFIDDPGLVADDKIGKRFIGLPGFAHQLPATFVTDYPARSLTVELLTLTDGAILEVGAVDSLPLSGEFKVRPDRRYLAEKTGTGRQ